MLAHKHRHVYAQGIALCSCDVLRVVNATRNAMGLDSLTALPKGRRQNQDFCVLAMALDGYVGLRRFQPFESGQVAAVMDYWGSDEHYPNGIEMPIELYAFVELFDDGEFPELELTAVEFHQLVIDMAELAQSVDMGNPQAEYVDSLTRPEWPLRGVSANDMRHILPRYKRDSLI